MGVVHGASGSNTIDCLGLQGYGVPPRLSLDTWAIHEARLVLLVTTRRRDVSRRVSRLSSMRPSYVGKIEDEVFNLLMEEPTPIGHMHIILRTCRVDWQGRDLIRVTIADWTSLPVFSFMFDALEYPQVDVC